MESDRPSPIPGVSRNVFLLGLVSLCTDVASEMLYPLIPLFLTATLGAPVSIVGVIEGAAEMTASVLKGFSGWWSDRVGRRLPFVTAGYALSATSKPLLALAGSWPMVLVARVSDRFGKGMRATARDAIIAESTKDQFRGRSFGFHRSADQVGAVIGPLLALPLLSLFHRNYRALFLVAFIPGAVSVALLFLVRETGRAVAHPDAEAPRFEWRKTPTRFRRYLLVTALFAVGNSSDVFLILRAKQVGFPDSQIFLLFAFFNAVTVLSAYPSGVLSDRMGRRTILVVGFFLFSLVYAGFGFVLQIRGVWLLFGAYGLFVGMTEGVARAYAVDLAGPEHRATALGLHSLAIGFTTFIASAVAGLLWTNVGPAAAFLYGAAMAVAAGIALMFI